MEPRRGAQERGRNCAAEPGDHQGSRAAEPRGPGLEPWGRGWSPGNTDGAAPWSPGTGVEPAAAAQTRATQARFSRECAAAASWAPGSALRLKLTAGKERWSFKGREMEGPEGSLLHKSGLDGVLCGVDLGPFSPGSPTGPNHPSPGLPLSRGGLDPWGVSPHFLPRPGHPLLPASPPKLPASLLHPRRPCSGPESRQEAGRSFRGEKGPREGKEEAAAATPCKKFREPPRTPPPSPFRVRTHPTSSRSPASSSGTHRWTSR